MASVVLWIVVLYGVFGLLMSTMLWLALRPAHVSQQAQEVVSGDAAAVLVADKDPVPAGVTFEALWRDELSGGAFGGREDAAIGEEPGHLLADGSSGLFIEVL